MTQLVVGEVQLLQVLSEDEGLHVQAADVVEAEVDPLQAGEVEDLLTGDGGDHVARQVQRLDVPETVGLADHCGESQVRHGAKLGVRKIQRVQVGHRAENPRLCQSHFVAAQVQSLEVGQTLEGAACKGENPLGGGLYVETFQPGQTEENSVRDLLEVAVDDAELLQPDEAPEAVGLQLADREGVGADDGERHGVLGRDDAEVGSLGLTVDGGEMAAQLQGSGL